MLKSIMAVLACVLLAGCVGTPLPFRIERHGSLPPDRYPAMEALTASVPSVLTAFGARSKTAFPEPFCVYAFDPGLELKTATLHINAISGRSSRASQVAADLRTRLVTDLAAAKLFAAVTSAPAPGALVLDGVVLVADTLDDTYGNQMARTQMEATVSREGRIVGVMQINAAQLDYSDFIPVASLLISAAGGSRVSVLSGNMVDVFKGLASGRFEGIDTETATGRFVRTPPP